MGELFPGRYTGKAPEDATALFMLGMRANTIGGLAKTVPVAAAMGRMLRHLAEHPEAGLLGFHNWFGRTTILVSYWRSAADVQRFASDPTAPHAPAWQKFNRQLNANSGVGIWHELYTVRPGDFEGIYSNMPVFGMAAAGEHLPIADGWRTSKQRMAAAAGPGQARPAPARP
jgi:hypothetical protein